MKHWIWIGGLSMAMAAQAWAQNARISFRVLSTSVPEGKTVYVIGNQAPLGNWLGAGLALVAGPDGAWTGAIDAVPGAEIEFKVTLGRWEEEALDANGRTPPNHALTVKGDEVVEIPVPAWKQARAPGGPAVGKVVVHPQMEGEGILPRDVQVWLPPSYERQPRRRYPVLYMHDGQQVFDPSTSTHGVTWGVAETIARLADEETLREAIVVAMNCTARRGEEYGAGPDGERYMDFVVHKVKPFIDETYRTLPNREHTAVMGASMGGLISFLLVWKHNDVFSMAGCLSPAFFLNFRELRRDDWPKRPTSIYIDNGGPGIEQMLQAGCDIMLETLPAKGFKLGRDLFWVKDPEAEHSEAAWAERVWMPLSMMFGKGGQAWKKKAREVPAPVFAGWTLEPEAIVEVGPFVAVGLEARVGGEKKHERIQALWERFGRSENLLSRPRQPGLPEYVGIATPGQYWRDDLYLAGLVVQPGQDVPEGMARREVPVGRYLKFTHRGTASDLGRTFEYLYQWWIPRSDQPVGEGSVELYGADYRPDDTNAVMTILLPLKDE